MSAAWLAVPLGVVLLGVGLWRLSERARRERQRHGRKPSPSTNPWWV